MNNTLQGFVFIKLSSIAKMPKEFHKKKLLKNETNIFLLYFVGFLLKWIPNAITAIRRSKSEQVFKSETTSFTKLWAPEPANKPPKCKQTRFNAKQTRFKLKQTGFKLKQTSFELKQTRFKCKQTMFKC